MVAGTLLPVGVGAEELPIDINNEEITVADVMMYEDTDMSEDEEENEAAAETEEVIDVVSEENSEEAPAETSEPEAAEPETTESEVSESEVSEPEVSEPEVTEPEVPDFEETEPDEIITEEELPADAPEEEIYFCGIEEHEHTEECRNAPEEPDGEIIVEEEIPEEEPQPEEEPGELYCGYEVHVHDDTCWNEEYLADCGMEEHEHSENCYSLAYTLMTEFAAAVELFPDEADYILLDFDEADGSELLDEEAYYAAYAAFYEENPDIWMTTDALFTEAEAAYAEENPDGDIDAWMQDNGFWEAAEKFYWVVPTPDAVAEKTAQMEEVELEFTAEEEEALELFALADGTVEDTASPDVTVKLFNYRKAINKSGISAAGYVFAHSEGNSVDGDNPRGNYDFSSWSNHKRLPLKSALTEDGYPDTMLHEGGGYTGRNAPEYPENDSLAYLFDEGTIEGKIVYPEMSGGGGLFQKDEDGYYVYDSAENAAYYDPENKKFVLYDKTIIRPSYTNAQSNIVREGNFLPFNEVTSDTVSNNDIQTYGDITGYKLSEPVDLWFGMVIEFEFLMPKDGLVNGEPMIFDFHGDDDVMVYIDDQLVLDISGSHYAERGTIDFEKGVATVEGTDRNGGTPGDLTVTKNFTEIFDDDDLEGGTFKDYTVHKLKFFYLERGGSISYCKLRFNMPTLPKNSITVGKELTVNNNTTGSIEGILKDTLTYKFRIMGENDQPLTSSNYSGTYKVYMDGNQEEATERRLDSTGIIELKSGERATFEDILATIGEDKTYYIEELIPTDLNGQYEGVQVEVDIDATEVKITEPDKTTTTYMGYKTVSYNTYDGSTYSVFNNIVNTNNLSFLQIEKQAEKYSIFTKDTQFRFKVELGGELLKDTQFNITSQNGDSVRLTDEYGILTLYADETATLAMGIVSGTEFNVTEVDGAAYYVDYDVKCYHPDGHECSEDHWRITDSDFEQKTDGGVSGEFALANSIKIIATNSSYEPGTLAEVTVTKQVTGNMGDRMKEFEFTANLTAADGTPIEFPSSEDGDYTVSEDGKTAFFTLKHDSSIIFKNIPIGSSFTVTEMEEESEGYTVYINNTENADADRVYAHEVVLPDDEVDNENTISFINDKTATIDTAVHLDYLPYILILTAVIPTMTLAVSRKRRRRED